MKIGDWGQALGYVGTVRLEGDTDRLVLGKQDAALSSPPKGHQLSHSQWQPPHPRLGDSIQNQIVLKGLK